MILHSVNAGLFDELPLETVKKAGQKLCSALTNHFVTEQQKIYNGERLTAKEKEQLVTFARSVLNPTTEKSDENA